MKRFLAFVLFTFYTATTAFLVACNNGNSTKQTTDNAWVDLSRYEVGSELSVYPTCEFDYKIDDECTVHINSVKATLTARNEIIEGTTLSERYYPYTVQLVVTATMSKEQAGQKLYLEIYPSPLINITSLLNSTVDENGNIIWSSNLKRTNIYYTIYLGSISK